MNEWSKGGPFLKDKQVQEVENYLESSPINSPLKKAMKSKRNQSIKFKDDYKTLASIARAQNNSTVSNPSMFGNPMDTFGLDAHHPMKSAGTLAMEGYGVYQAGKQAVIRAKGGYISKENYTTAQNKETYRINVNKPRYYNVKKKNYTEYNLKNGNPAKLKAFVNKADALKEGFNIKGMSGKLGYAGMALSAGSDIYEGIKHHQSGSEITGHVTSDVVVGGVSIAASAVAGAQVGAAVGTFAGPVGMAAGLIVGAGVSYFLSGVKLFNGKSVADEISTGTKKAVEGVKHFFGHLF